MSAAPVTATGGGRWRHGARLALGTLTVVRTGAVRVEPGVAGAAMLLAPLVGVAVGGVAAGAGWVVTRLAGPWLGAVAAVGLVAAVTRALHLDGLADTADGLGCGRAAEAALRVMKASDIGPFGVVVLVLVLLAEVAAAARCFAAGTGVFAAVAAAVVGRMTLPWMCRRGVPSARPEGLGAAVAGTVPGWAAWSAVVAGVAALAGCAAAVRAAGLAAPAWPRVAAAGVLGLVAAGALGARCVRRFGGITGDVLGAAVEVGTVVAVAVLATG